MALPMGMWQTGFVFAAVSSIYLTQSRKVLWAIPTLLAWVLIAYTSTNVAVTSGGTTTLYGSTSFAWVAVFMAAFTFIQLVLYGLLARREPDQDADPTPERAVGSVSDQLEDSL